MAALTASLLRGERGDRGDRAEDLLGEHARVGGHPREHGGGVEVARAIECVPAGEHAGAALGGVAYQLGDDRALAVVDQRADVGVGLGAAAHAQRSHPLGESPRELLGQRLVHVEAVGGRAGLADVAHLRGERALDGGVEIGVLEHQEGGVAAELHRDAQDLLGGLLDQRAPDLGGAGERQLAGARVAQQRLDHGAGAVGGDRVEDAPGQPRLLQNLRQSEHRERRLLGGLDDDRAAGGDRGGELARAHRHREVPRRDEHAGADRLAHREDPPGARGVDHVAAVDAHGLLGEPAQEVGGVGDLRAGFGQRLAHLERHQQRELLGARGERLVGTAQDLAPLARRPAGPFGLVLGSRGERGERICGLRVGDLDQRLPGGGILDGERPARRWRAASARRCRARWEPLQALRARRCGWSSLVRAPLMVGVVAVDSGYMRSLVATLLAIALCRRPDGRGVSDAGDQGRGLRPRRGDEPGGGAGVCRARVHLPGDPRPLLHRHRAGQGVGADEGDGDDRREGARDSAGNVRTRRGGGGDARGLAAGGARGAGGCESHIRAHRPRRRIALRRVRRHALAGVPRREGPHGRDQRGGGGNRRAGGYVRGAARDHLLLRQLGGDDRERPERLPGRRPRAVAARRAGPLRPGPAAQLDREHELRHRGGSACGAW